MNSRITAISTILFAVVFFSGCATKDLPQKVQPSHNTLALKGYFPYLGPDIRVPASQGSVTTVQFPLRVSSVHFLPGAPIRLRKKYDQLWVQAARGLENGGVQVSVRLIDGREYILRVRPAEDRERLFVSVGFGNIFVEPKIPNDVLDYTRASYSSPAKAVLASTSRTFLDAMKSGRAYRFGLSKLKEKQGLALINTPELSAVVTDAYLGRGLVGYKLQVSNRLDKPIELTKKAFSSHKTLAVEIQRPWLAESLPAFQSSPTERKASSTYVYIIERSVRA